MKIFIFLFFLLLWKNLSALEVKCSFEEAYQDGSVQQGIILLKEDYLRYQYLNQDLYTIINNKKGLFLVNNRNRLPQTLDVNTEIIDFLIDQSLIFPNNKDSYSSENFKAKIINSQNHHFIKNIIITGKNTNLNIHFYDCDNEQIDRLVFHHNPLQYLK
ncbi:hypothetical protein OAS25_05735 [Alphaproteobacteria bacterium]|jgi:hypothetical protein|nr:hypothetical protein [Alphaproteobacteria bacterium]